MPLMLPQAGSRGGAIGIYSVPSARLASLTFADNYAEFYGGAVDTSLVPDMTLVNSTFDGNKAGMVGDVLMVG